MYFDDGTPGRHFARTWLEPDGASDMTTVMLAWARQAGTTDFGTGMAYLEAQTLTCRPDRRWRVAS